LSRDDFYKPTDADALRMENELLAFEARFLKARLAETERIVASLESAKRDKEQQLSATNRDLQERTSALRQKESEVSRLQQQLSKRESEVSRLQQQLSKRESEVSRLREQLADLQGRRAREVEKLNRWIEGLDLASSALLNSQRWKIGNAFGEALRKASLRPRAPMAEDRLRGIIEEFHAWRESRERENMAPPGPPVPQAPVHSARSPLADGLPKADVVVCVHNALDDVKACLASVTKNTPEGSMLYIVNDGSDEPTTGYLREFSSARKSCTLLESSTAEGYTRAANKGLRASTADYVVLLNSDTIVPSGWLEKLLECGESDSRIGIVGPLSNAASWQSVPEIHDKGDWATNPLPEGYGVEDMAEVVAWSSERRFPRVPFVNGFCFAIKRSLIEAIGYLDEENFPNGYGEENDYCLRAADAGFELAVADHAYIYHAKSKSYSHEQRHVLRKPGGAALNRKHGDERISRDLDVVRNEPTLQKIRQQVRVELEMGLRHSMSEDSPFKVLFLLPTKGGGGGVHSIVQEVQGMQEIGVFAQIAVPSKYRGLYLRSYPSTKENVFYFFDSPQGLIEYARNFEVVVATIFTSVEGLLKSIHEAIPEILPAYYIQDYEPWIAKDSDAAEEAKDSYVAIPNMLCFAKTDWIRETIKRFHGIEVHKVSPSLDHSAYYPRFGAKSEGTVEIAAMVRPATPRRAPAETMRVLKSIKDKYGDGVSVTIFGCKPDDPLFLALPRDFEFENRGVLIREEVAELLRTADIFLDLSEYQAFGRTGLEAMACGCATVLPMNGGTAEYARHRDNALLVDTKNFEEMVGAAKELIEDGNLRRELSRQGVLTASGYSVQGAVVSELYLFQEAIQRRAGIGGEGGSKSRMPVDSTK